MFPATLVTLGFSFGRTRPDKEGLVSPVPVKNTAGAEFLLPDFGERENGSSLLTGLILSIMDPSATIV